MSVPNSTTGSVRTSKLGAARCLPTLSSKPRPLAVLRWRLTSVAKEGDTAAPADAGWVGHRALPASGGGLVPRSSGGEGALCQKGKSDTPSLPVNGRPQTLAYAQVSGVRPLAQAETLKMSGP